MLKRWNLFLLLILLVTLVGCNASEIDENIYVEKAKILNVVEEEVEGGYFETVQMVTLQIKSGSYKGEELTTENIISDAYLYDIEVKEGDRVIVELEVLEDQSFSAHIIDFARDLQIYMLLILFILTLLIVGKWKGIKTVITLFCTIFVVFKVLLPLLIKGMNPILITIFAAAAITVITILLISGTKRKGIAAMIGTILGVVISGGLAYMIGSKVHLTGLSSDEAAMLTYLPNGIQFDFRGLLFSGILLGALGAVMDVSMSIASSIEELNKVNSELSWQSLYSSGMTVGRDIMGTMANTLILAYTGSSLPLLLLLFAYDSPMNKMINMDMIATEIIRSLAGSIGIVLTIPITATVSVLLLKGMDPNRKKND